MKATLRNILIIALLALSGTMQVTAVSYNNVPSSKYQVQNTTSFGVTTVPMVGFQSTSAYSGQWNQDAQQSLLNTDGSVNADAFGVGQSKIINRPRRVDANGDGYDDVTGLPVNPIVDPNDPGNVPLGDGILPLMLLACAFVIYKVLRRRRIIES